VAEVRLRTVDAFTDRPFTGNPGAVVMLDEIPSDDWMAAVARETNLSDTGFVIRQKQPDADFLLRWFTRGGVEVDLCGHVTLASGHCLFEDGIPSPVKFSTRSGVLTVTRREDGSLGMDFPAWPAAQIEAPAGLEEMLGATVQWTGRSGNNFLLVRVADENAIRTLEPDLPGVARLPADVLVVTAPADPRQDYDFVSRVFAPTVGIDEDPVTGSAQTVLAPYWADRVGRSSLQGLQASSRSGRVGVELQGDRVVVIGRAVTVLDGILKATANAG
jgi:PhzF family phenazine biosynthesis protein